MDVNILKNTLVGVGITISSFLGLQPTPPLAQDPALERHALFHYPKPDDLNKKTLPMPYLTLPFKKADLTKNPLNKEQLYDVTEGWMYSQEELAISGSGAIHGGIDIYVPYGTDIVSPVDGYAVSSYNTAWIRDGRDLQEEVKADNEEYKKPIKIYKGKKMREGLGYFIYIYAPQINRYLEFAHLSEIDEAIPFSPPYYASQTDAWLATNHMIKVKDLATNPYVVPVKKGQVIGKVGYSGMSLGYDDYTEGAGRPIDLTFDKYESWDEPHVHFEEFWFNQETELRGWQRDPYAIYDTNEKYPTTVRKGKMGKDHLWILDKDGLPKFTK